MRYFQLNLTFTSEGISDPKINSMSVPPLPYQRHIWENISSHLHHDKSHRLAVPFWIVERAREPKTHSATRVKKAYSITGLKLSANSLPIHLLPIRPAETVCQFERKKPMTKNEW